MSTNIHQWRGLQNVWPCHRETVQKFLSKLDLHSLEGIASEARNGISCKLLANHFTTGRERIVFQIVFSDGVTWIARISLPPLSATPDDDTLVPVPGREVLLSEIITLRYLARKTSLPLPSVHVYDLEPSNPLGAAYQLMTQMNGKLIRPYSVTPVTDIPHIYGQRADIVLTLSKLTFDKIGFLSGENEPAVRECIFMDFSIHKAFTTASEYYTTRSEEVLEEKRREVPPNEDWIVFAWLFVESIPHFLIKELNNGPFPLHHPDLHNSNLLYDENNVISAVLDWTAAGTFPWEIVMAPPFVLDAAHYPERRKMYIDIFEAKELASTGSNRFATFMRSPASEIIQLVNDNYSTCAKRFPVQQAERLAKLVFGSSTNWEDVKQRYKEHRDSTTSPEVVTARSLVDEGSDKGTVVQ